MRLIHGGEQQTRGADSVEPGHHRVHDGGVVGDPVGLVVVVDDEGKRQDVEAVHTHRVHRPGRGQQHVELACPVLVPGVGHAVGDVNSHRAAGFAGDLLGETSPDLALWLGLDRSSKRR